MTEIHGEHVILRNITEADLPTRRIKGDKSLIASTEAALNLAKEMNLKAAPCCKDKTQSGLRGASVNIRILTAEDASEYRDLRLEALTTNPEAFATTYEDYVSRTIEQVASQLAPDDDHYTLGAFIGDGLAKIVGTVTLVRERSPKVRHIANLVAMYVSPDTRRKGVGRHLLTELIGRARQLDGLDQLRLCVIQDNPAAIRLYRSVGFQTFGIEPNALKTADRSWDEVHMVLPFIGEGDLEARFHNQPELSASHGFSHVTINVSNLETSLRFYVGTLGMKLVHRGRRDAYIEWGTAWICLHPTFGFRSGKARPA